MARNKQLIFHQPAEKGQAMVLLVLAVVALLGFTALAVDGSMVYSDRRFAQSGADAAALAGAAAASEIIANNNITEVSWSCSNSAVTQAQTVARDTAISAAATNDFIIDADTSDNHGVQVLCMNSATDRYIDVQVMLTAETQVGMTGVVYDGPARNTVTATARVRPKRALAFGYTIVALNPAACQGQQNGALFHGNPDVHVCGGGIYSNGCLKGVGNIDVTVKDLNCQPKDQGIYYATEYDGGGSFSPNPTWAPHLDPDSYRLDFTPEELCARPGAVHINAKKNGLPSELDPGLYCITGDVKLAGNKGGKLHGNGVTLVFLQGSLQCSGNCDMVLSAPAANPDPFPAVPGLLMYSLVPARSNDKFNLNGNNNSYFTGTILLPNADVVLLGTGNENSFKTQVIAWNFEGGGTNDSTYKWFDDLMVTRPVTLELDR
jgi:hypothetical protein